MRFLHIYSKMTTNAHCGVYYFLKTISVETTPVSAIESAVYIRSSIYSRKVRPLHGNSVRLSRLNCGKLVLNFVEPFVQKKSLTFVISVRAKQSVISSKSIDLVLQLPLLQVAKFVIDHDALCVNGFRDVTSVALGLIYQSIRLLTYSQLICGLISGNLRL